MSGLLLDKMHVRTLIQLREMSLSEPPPSGQLDLLSASLRNMNASLRSMRASDTMVVPQKENKIVFIGATYNESKCYPATKLLRNDY